VAEARARIPSHPFADLKRLGIDEIAMRKGKRNFGLILTNLDTGEVADVLEKRTQEKLRSRLEQLPEEERAQIEEVALALWEPYADVWEELLPNACLAVRQATITVDRFHVMQAITKELKVLKNQEKKQHPCLAADRPKP